MQYLWQWFLALNNARSSGMAPNPISHQEIKAFCELRGIRMSLFEMDALQALDSVALTDTETLTKEIKEA